MNFSCLLSLAVLRTPPSPWDTLFPLGVGLVLDSSVFSLVCALPSPASAQGFPSLFGRFTGVGSEEARSVSLALASVRRSNCTCGFPAYSFHEDSLAGTAIEGINRIRFTNPNSP